MTTHRSTSASRGLLAAALVLLPPFPASAQGRDSLAVSQIPAPVMQTLRSRFPGAEIRKWTRETEDGVVLYDIEFTQQSRKLEADIKADGSIHNWEREIALQDVPEVVRQAVQTKFPGSTVSLVLAVTAVKGSTEALQEYEIIVVTANREEMELTVAPDGKVLAESRVDPRAP